MGCEVKELPIIYLGLPLGKNPRLHSFWDPVVAKVSKRLDGWKRTYFSLGARVTIIQSCLSNIPICFLSLFKAPKGVVVNLEKLMREFLWSGSREEKRDHLIGWDLVRRPKEEGGLGLGNIEAKNLSLLGKWLWRYLLEADSLWHKVIKSKFGSPRD